MSTVVVRRMTPQVRLKALLAEPGGTSAGLALQRADANLQSVREECLAAIDQKIDEMAALTTGGGAERGEAVYQLANEVFGEAGALGASELSAAAYSLCCLISAPGAKYSDAATRVHVEAMRALRRPELAGDEVARGAVLAGLKKLSARAAEAAAPAQAAPQAALASTIDPAE